MASKNQRPFWTNRMKSYQCKQADINRLIMSYLLREGYKDAARSFQAQAKLKSAKLDSQQYRNAVRDGQLQYAMDTAKKLYKKFDSDNYMYFHMQQMQLFELLRQRKQADAVNSTSAALNGPPSQAAQALEGTPMADIWSLTDSSDHDLESTILKHEEAESMEPRLVFLIKLILWAQNKLDNEHVCIDDGDGDYEMELMRALQHSV